MSSINWSIAIRKASALAFFTENPVLENEQLGYEVDTRLFKVGDGVTAWNSLAYSTASFGSSIWQGLSTDADNLLEVSAVDQGFTLKESAFTSLAEVDGAIGGTVTDLAPYATANVHKAASLRLGILLRAVVNALGTDFAGLFAGNAPAETVSEALAAVQLQLTALSDGALRIDDGVVTLLKTWSSSKINAEIATAVSNLVGSAPETLNTLAEFASALNNNASFATTMTNELANSVKVVPQTLTDPQKLQARANIGITDAFGGVVFKKVTADYTAVHKDGLLTDTSAGAFTVTLPASPTVGTNVLFMDDWDWSTNNVIVACNGSTIEGVLDNVNLNLTRVTVQFIYDGVTWRVYVQSGIGGNAIVSGAVQAALDLKQPALVSGTNVKTINGASLLGSGDVAVQPALVSGTNVKTVNGASLLGSGNIATGDVTLAGVQALSGKTITDIVYAIPGTSPAFTAANGGVQTWALSGASTPTDALTTGQSFVLIITPGAYGITWPAGMVWTKQGGSGTLPTLFTAGKTHVVIYKIGTVLYGSWLGDTI